MCDHMTHKCMKWVKTIKEREEKQSKVQIQVKRKYNGIISICPRLEITHFNIALETQTTCDMVIN